MKNYELRNERVRGLREAALNKTPSVCIERARYLTEGYRQHEARSKYIKRTLAIKNVLEKMSIYIKEGELVVGNQAVDQRTAPIFPEYAAQWMEDELREKGNFNKRAGDNFYLPEEHHKELLEIVDYWRGKTLRAKCYGQMPEEMMKAAQAKVIHGEGNMTSGDGHIVPDFEKALNVGLEGVIEEAKEQLKRVDITEFGGYNKRDFLESTIIMNEAVIAFAKRYSELARELAKKEGDEVRKAELLEISRICDTVPAKAPGTFKEGVQMIWFIHLVIQIESNGHSASLGRVDQYLYPLYERDIRDGAITREEAKELLQCLWIKLYSILKVRPTSHSGYGAGYPTYQNVTIGGSTFDGRDCVNELSYLILESVAEAKLTQPNLSARLHSASPERFVRECASVAATGFGMPALHTDEIIVPALLNKGVKFEDAYNYTMVGCVEVAVPGKWGYRCTGMSFINLVKTLELTLNDGYDSRTGFQLHRGEGRLTDFETYEDFLRAWDNNVAYYTRLTVALDALADTHLEEFPDIFCSALVNDCIQRGKTAKEGGAQYDIVAGLQVGIANAANSVMALKKVVYEEERLTLEELDKALKNNFQGDEGERVRQLLLEVPKYGNDIDEVDEVANRVYKSYIDEIKRYKNTRHGRGPIGGDYGLSTSGISSNVPMGCVTGATPDGRYAYTPAAEGASPVQGTDLKGPTAVLNSILKLPTILLTGGQLLNQKFSPELISTPAQFEKFVNIIKTFVRKKGWHIQFNIISADTLREAQNNPEEHKDIIVRIAGYCAQFVTLDKTTQEDIISRTEQNF